MNIYIDAIAIGIERIRSKLYPLVKAQARKHLIREVSLINRFTAGYEFVEIKLDLARRLRQTMIEKLTAIPGADAAVAATALPKAVASSSTREGLERKLRQVGLWDHFAPHVYSAGHVVKAKPAPDLFLHAAAALDIAPADCLVLEDSVNGVLAGMAAGMTVWGFLGGGHATDGLGERLLGAGAERLVRDWAEAARLLAEIG